MAVCHICCGKYDFLWLFATYAVANMIFVAVCHICCGKYEIFCDFAMLRVKIGSRSDRDVVIFMCFVVYTRKSYFVPRKNAYFHIKSGKMRGIVGESGYICNKSLLLRRKKQKYNKIVQRMGHGRRFFCKCPNFFTSSFKFQN